MNRVFDDVIINKIAVIERCLARITEVYQQATDFQQDYTRQDSVILNLQRACEASIDIANYINRKKQLGIPQSSRDSFHLLFKANIISQNLSANLQAMVGLRNIAVHDYQELNLNIVEHFINHHLSDFDDYINTVKKFSIC